MPGLIDKTYLLKTLQDGELDLQGQFLRGSNYTFLSKLRYKGDEFSVVYKPTRGEQPLWDFPTGTLAKREVVAYRISEALDWDLVPVTVYRQKAPLGPGSLQLYVDHNPDYHYFNFDEDDRQRLRPVMLFDALINNADRKGSHILIDDNDELWIIDHGLCFHAEDKLRTVVWDFAGESIPIRLLENVRSLLTMLESDESLLRDLRGYLSPLEVRAMVTRGRRLLDKGCFPYPASDRRATPWPPV